MANVNKAAFKNYIDTFRDMALGARTSIEKISNNMQDQSGRLNKLIDYSNHTIHEIIAKVGETESDAGWMAVAYSAYIDGGNKTAYPMAAVMEYICSLDSLLDELYILLVDINNNFLNGWKDEWTWLRREVGTVFERIAECSVLNDELTSHIKEIHIGV